MITEFKSGIYTANYATRNWGLYERGNLIGFIDGNGLLMYYVENNSFHSASIMRSIADIMDNITKQKIELTKINGNDN